MKPYLLCPFAVLLMAGCASLELPPLPQVVTQTPANAPLTTVPALRPFEDILIPGGLVYQQSRSTIIESPVAKSARLVYVGTLPLDLLRDRVRAGLEDNGWRHITSSSSPDLGTTQMYEKDGASLQVVVRESTAPYTELHLIVSRAVGRTGGQALPASAPLR
jgi:hypothetical protein